MDVWNGCKMSSSEAGGSTRRLSRFTIYENRQLKNIRRGILRPLGDLEMSFQGFKCFFGESDWMSDRSHGSRGVERTSPGNTRRWYQFVCKARVIGSR